MNAGETSVSSHHIEGKRTSNCFSERHVTLCDTPYRVRYDFRPRSIITNPFKRTSHGFCAAIYIDDEPQYFPLITLFLLDIDIHNTLSINIHLFNAYFAL